MRDVMMEGRRFSDEMTEDFTSYFTIAFGPNSPKPQSPEDMPEYKSLVRPFSPNAMNIAYVEYDFAALNGMGPWSAVEDKEGMMWIPYYGRGNAVVRLDPKTGEQTSFPLGFAKKAGIHSAVPGARWQRLVHRSRARQDRASRPGDQADHRISEPAAARWHAHRRAHHSRG